MFCRARQTRVLQAIVFRRGRVQQMHSLDPIGAQAFSDHRTKLLLLF